MAFGASYLIPAREVPSHMVKVVRDNLCDKLAQLSLNSGVVTSVESLVIRDILPNTDLSMTSNWWLSPALVANTEVTYATVALNNKRHLGIYGIFVESAAPAVADMYFRIGAAGSTTFQLVNLERMYAEQESVGYLAEPVIYAPNETVFIRALPRIAAAAGERIGLLGFIAEPKGEQVSGSRSL